MIQDSRIDQSVGRFSANLEDLSKVLDVVNSLRVLSVKPGEFNSCRKSVNRILALYDL